MHPFPLFLSLFFLFLLQTETLLTYISTYLYFIYLCAVRYADKHRVFFRSFLCLCLLIRFVALCGFIFAFTAFLCLFLFLHQPTHPTPISRYRIGGYPIPYFFIFQFSKIFLLKKCGMIYLHLECVYVGMKCLHIRCCLCVVG